uniref:Ataxin-7-like protein 3 n=1 Tax=Periophthalmus magnuspinnatus TaxID=409849 RepID=A0A3B4ALP0_9GOBI
MKMEDMPLSGPDNTRLEALVHDIYSELVDDACLGLCFEVHRAVKQGYFFLDETDPESMKEFEIVDQPGVDIFGQVYNQWKNKECECPNCKRLIAASRFAPHLEKCLGMGRNSSRIANRRLATNNTMSKSESDQEDNDDLNDNDWSYGNQTSPRRSKSLKHKNGNCFYNYSSGINYETLGPDEVRSVLTTVRMCNATLCPSRSQRCPQHTDEQRRAVRVFLLGPSAPPLPDADAVTESDSFDIPDGQSLMSRLQWEDSPDVSPTDSASSKASTNHSDSRRPKKKKRMSLSMNSSSGGGGGGGGGGSGGGGSAGGPSGGNGGGNSSSSSQSNTGLSSKKKRPKPSGPSMSSIYDD